MFIKKFDHEIYEKAQVAGSSCLIKKYKSEMMVMAERDGLVAEISKE